MLQPILHKLNSQKIVLASASPRRKGILENVGLTFTVSTSNFDETLDQSRFSKPEDYAVATANGKVQDVARCLDKQRVCADLIIGADTVVSMEGQIYEKPRDKDHAFEILSKFSGKTHSVHTGVILMVRNPEASDGYDTTTFTETTDVIMAPLSSQVIHSYIETGEPMDKAGGYGIQGRGGSLIEAIRGDYYNVMGFPLHSFCRHIVQIYKHRYPDLAQFY